MEQNNTSMRKRLQLWKTKRQQTGNCKRKTVVAFGLTSSDEKENVLRSGEDFKNKRNQKNVDVLRPASIRCSTLGNHLKQQEAGCLSQTAAKVTRRLTLPNQNRKREDSQKAKLSEKCSQLDVPLLKRRKTLGAKFEGVSNFNRPPVKNVTTTSTSVTGPTQRDKSTKHLIRVEPILPRNVTGLSTKKQPPINKREQSKTGTQRLLVNHRSPGKWRTLTVLPRANKTTQRDKSTKHLISAEPILPRNVTGLTAQKQPPTNKREQSKTGTQRPPVNHRSPGKRRTLTVQPRANKTSVDSENIHPTRRTETVSTATFENLRKKTSMNNIERLTVPVTTKTESRRQIANRGKETNHSQSSVVGIRPDQKFSSSVRVTGTFHRSGSNVVPVRNSATGCRAASQAVGGRKVVMPVTGQRKTAAVANKSGLTNKYEEDIYNDNRKRKVTGKSCGGTVAKTVCRKELVPLKSATKNTAVKRTVVVGAISASIEAKCPKTRKFETIKSRIDTGLKGKKTNDIGRRSSPHATKVRFNTPKSNTQQVQTLASLSTPVRSTSAVVRDRLDEWLQSKGKTPSRFQNLVGFQESSGRNVHVEGGLSVAELNHQQKQLELEAEELDERRDGSAVLLSDQEVNTPKRDKVHNLLTECLLLLQSGCPAESVLLWLGEIENSLPGVRLSAKYYVLRSQIAEQQGATDAQVIDIFEEAVRNNATPPDEVSNALTEFVDRMKKKRNKRVLSPVMDSSPVKTTPRKRQRLEQDNIIPSSIVKFNLSRTTPFFSRLRARAEGQPTPCGVVTPVRRSTRLSSTPLPIGVTVLDRLDDMSPGTKSEVLYQPNSALQPDFDSVME